MAKKEKARVLIVDDEKAICDLLKDDLSERGYLCTAALRGEDALARLQEKRYDAVLLDIRLPGMSGIEVLREIWLHHRNVPTIMITAVNDVNTAVEAMRYGATDYVVKPFDLDRVNQSIQASLMVAEASDSQESMESIARGVESQVDPFHAFSSVITERTVNVARALGIAEAAIQRWLKSKVQSNPKKRRNIKSSN